MTSLLKSLTSQVGRKLLTGITGVALVLFVIVHLIGNLALFGSPEAFNAYTYFLESQGVLLYIAEAGLVLIVLVHTYLGVSIWWGRRKARPHAYAVYSSKGGNSRQNLRSRSMIFTGSVLLAFLVFHVNHFKFGETEMITLSSGVEGRDLKQLVLDSFTNPALAFGYTFVMLLLGVHLGHGVWSAMTSLTMRRPETSKLVYSVGTVVAILLAVGFLFIPLYIYFTGAQGALIHYQY